MLETKKHWMDNPEVGFFIKIGAAEKNNGLWYCLCFFHRYKLMLHKHPLFLRYFETEHDQSSLCLHFLSWSILYQIIVLRGSMDVLNLNRPDTFQMLPSQSGGLHLWQACAQSELADINKGDCTKIVSRYAFLLLSTLGSFYVFWLICPGLYVNVSYWVLLVLFYFFKFS